MKQRYTITTCKGVHIRSLYNSLGKAYTADLYLNGHYYEFNTVKEAKQFVTTEKQVNHA